jgi:hypothetical protein
VGSGLHTCTPLFLPLLCEVKVITIPTFTDGNAKVLSITYLKPELEPKA